MKPIFFLAAAVMIFSGSIHAQTSNLHGTYKAVTISMDQNVPYSKTLILLHEIYNGTLIPNNFAVGSLMAIRGAINSIGRLNVVQITSGSAYQNTRASFYSQNDGIVAWKLKTCIYNGKKYMAIDIPYQHGQHSQGYHFVGWTASSGENLKTVTYEVNGVPQNQHLLSDVQDYSSPMYAQHEVSRFIVNGRVGIGTTTPREHLSVNGNIRAKEVKVEAANWPDYVFLPDYPLIPLPALEAYIDEHGHLPGIPTADEVAADGIGLAEMNRKLLEKVEELTLHLIELKKVVDTMNSHK